MRRPLAKVMLFAGLCCVLRCGHARADDASNREYAVKAAFVYNFAQFTQWPPEAFESADSPLVIGVLGENNPIEPAM
jgi:hypothetical protein